MFITEQVASISENKNGLWTVRFSSSSCVFNYNHSRLLYLTRPEAIDISEKGLYVRNRHVMNVSELLRFTDGRHTFYRVTYANGYCENLDGNEVYVTRTPIDRNGGSTWDYLRKLAAETGLTETGNAQKQAVQDAGTTALKQVNTAGQNQTDKVNKAGEDKLAQINAVNAHPPIVQGGTWWTWDTASGAYTDTGLTAEGKDGNVLFATFAVDPATGLLSMTTPDGYAGPEFALNNGYLEVTVNA